MLTGLAGRTPAAGENPAFDEWAQIQIGQWWQRERAGPSLFEDDGGVERRFADQGLRAQLWDAWTLSVLQDETVGNLKDKVFDLQTQLVSERDQRLASEAANAELHGMIQRMEAR